LTSREAISKQNVSVTTQLLRATRANGVGVQARTRGAQHQRL
jgi:hypothetical protein